MVIDKLKYNEFVIEVFYSKETKNFYTTSEVGSTVGHESVKKAIKAAKKEVDNFLKISINNYAELASAITETLNWTSQTDCYADETVIKHLVESLIKRDYKPSKQNEEERLDAAYVRLHSSLEDFERVSLNDTQKTLCGFTSSVFHITRGNGYPIKEFLDIVLQLDEEYYPYIVSAIEYYYDATKK